MSYIIAVDIGGTFTDLVACDVATGAVAFTKSPTTYGNLGAAIFDCIRKARLDRGEDPAWIEQLEAELLRAAKALAPKPAG